MAPATYGGTVMSCALVLVNPIPFVIVGKVNLVPAQMSALIIQVDLKHLPYEHAEMQSNMYACIYRRQLQSTIFKSFH
jgi:hypothetical protein